MTTVYLPLNIGTESSDAVMLGMIRFMWVWNYKIWHVYRFLGCDLLDSVKNCSSIQKELTVLCEKNMMLTSDSEQNAGRWRGTQTWVTTSCLGVRGLESSQSAFWEAAGGRTECRHHRAGHALVPRACDAELTPGVYPKETRNGAIWTSCSRILTQAAKWSLWNVHIPSLPYLKCLEASQATLTNSPWPTRSCTGLTPAFWPVTADTITLSLCDLCHNHKGLLPTS